MDLHKTIGFGIGLLGVLMIWQALANFTQTPLAQGPVLLVLLLFDGDHALRILSALAAFTAGLAALTEKQGGEWLAGFATALLYIQGLILVTGQGYVYAWQTEAVTLVTMTALFLAYVVSKPDMALATANMDNMSENDGLTA